VLYPRFSFYMAILKTFCRSAAKTGTCRSDLRLPYDVMSSEEARENGAWKSAQLSACQQAGN